MNIFLIGQTSLHWGRMEFGNIGNYYIIEPFVRQLHKVFSNARIKTTLQLSDKFCFEEQIERLPMDLYYGFDGAELTLAMKEVEIARHYETTGVLIDSTPYIEEVMSSDLIVDFSGDIWGDNADFLGEDRFEVGLYKNMIAQKLGKKTAMLAGSPGPFKNERTRELARTVFEGFDLVTNRESISTNLLRYEGFDTSNVVNLACPAFLFEPAEELTLSDPVYKNILLNKETPVVGFVLCGWNFEEGPFDKLQRSDDEFIKFAEVIEFITENLGAKVCLMSHSNGFMVPPETFELIHGRDYPIIKQLENVIKNRGYSKEVYSLNDVYDPKTTKSLISHFDMLVTGRVHAAVAALSQFTPTVIIDYGHEPKAHKLKGFAKVVEVDAYVSDPSSTNDMIDKVKVCWENIQDIKRHLQNRIPIVQHMAQENFSLLAKLFNESE